MTQISNESINQKQETPMRTIISIGIGILIGICVTVIAIVVIADMGEGETNKKMVGKR